MNIMSKTSRAAVLALAVLAALYGAGWFYLSARFAEAVTLWLDAQRAEGIEISRAGLARGGFPLRFEARLIEPSVRFAVGRASWTWTPGRAVFSAAPWTPDRVTLDLSGDHALAAAEARFTARADEWVVKATPRGARADALVLVGTGIEASGTGETFAVARLAAHWRRAAAPPADHSGESQSFEIAVEGVRLPEYARLPLGPEIARLKISGRVMGELASLRPGMGAGALGTWRDGGGTVEIAQLDARHGALTIAGEGTLALDGAMQPIAALTARIEGFAEAIDGLRDRGALARRDAAAAKLVLTALAVRGADGRNRLSTPLTVQDGWLFAGPVALLRLPPIPW